MMFRNIFQGRYGFDVLGIFIMLIALIFSRIEYLWILSLVLMAYVVFRVMSKDIGSRYRELQKFNKLISPITSVFYTLRRKFSNFRSRSGQKKFYVFVKCEKCRNTLRLPRNKGKLQVTCPVCKTQFIKKT